MLKANYTDNQITAYESKLNKALKTGYSILEKGGSSIEAVEQTVVVLENSPIFNAAKGAEFIEQ